MMRPIPRGLTLIELVVALAVFSVLGVLSYKGVSQVLGGQAAIHEELERWREVSRALLRLENDLLQVASLPISASTPSVPALLTSDEGQELQWLAVTGTGEGTHRVGFRLEGNALQWLRWDDRDGNGPPRRDELLTGVRAVQWRFIHGGQTYTEWPPEANLAQTLPAGVEVSLELDRIGTVTRLYALR